MVKIVATLAALCFAAAHASWGRQPPPPKEELAESTGRGRLLAGYDTAAWHATDAVLEMMPEPGSVTRHVAKRTDSGWTVGFGRLVDDQDKFLVCYEAVQAGAPRKFEVKRYDPPREDTGFYRSAARAIETAIRGFKGVDRPYNAAVLPADKSRMYVYLVPAPTRPGIWPLGGDVRFLVSGDGSRIIEKRELHDSIIEKGVPKEGLRSKLVTGVHTHVLSDTPEDTDVFHVLVRKPAAPEIVVTDNFTFRIDVDGGIEYLGRRENVLDR